MIWAKALHVFVVLTWMAAIGAAIHAISRIERGKRGEDEEVAIRAMTRGANPAIVAAFAAGLVTAGANLPLYLAQSWFVIKLACAGSLVLAQVLLINRLRCALMGRPWSSFARTAWAALAIIGLGVLVFCAVGKPL